MDGFVLIKSGTVSSILYTVNSCQVSMMEYLSQNGCNLAIFSVSADVVKNRC